MIYVRRIGRMRMGHRIIAVVVLAVSAGAAPGAQPATQPANPRPYTVDSLIDEILTRLVHDNWRVRAAAEAELADLGELAVPRLRALVARSPNPEIRTRARAALEQIAADAKAGTRPVTLRLHNAPAREAFRSLAVSSGFDPRPVPADLWERREARDLPPVTLEMRRRPFWEAYRALHGQTGIGLRAAADGQWSLRTDGDPRLHVKQAVVSGPFLLVPEISWNLPIAPASPVLRGPSAPAPIPPPLDTSRLGPGMTLRVLVFAEPRLRLAGGFGAAVIREATDDKNVRLDRPPAARRPEFAPPLLATPADGAWAFAAHLTAPAGDAAALALCKGSIRASVALRHERLELADPLAARDKPLSAGELRAVVVEMKRAAQQPGRYFLSVSVDLEGRSLDRGALLCSLNHGGLKVLDAAGRAYACRVGGISGSAQRTVVMVEVSNPTQWGEPGIGAPAKLVWDAPVETRMVDIPFEFKDVPLP
jgi:hypothetical protein